MLLYQETGLRENVLRYRCFEVAFNVKIHITRYVDNFFVERQDDTVLIDWDRYLRGTHPIAVKNIDAIVLEVANNDVPTQK